MLQDGKIKTNKNNYKKGNKNKPNKIKNPRL